MREFARCLAWALAVGAVALLLAVFAGRGLAQADGALAWLVLAIYAPFYFLGHAFSGGSASGLTEASLDAAVFAAQFAYFLFFVFALRYAWRRRRHR
jgi:hypothetical protein